LFVLGFAVAVGCRVRLMPGVRPGGRPTSLGVQRSRQERRPCKTARRGRVPCVPCRLHAAWRSSGVAQHAGAVLGPVSLHRSPGPRRTRAATLCSNRRREVGPWSALRARPGLLRFSAV